MERYRRNLEAKSGQQKHQAEHQADAAGLRCDRDPAKLTVPVKP